MNKILYTLVCFANENNYNIASCNIIEYENKGVAILENVYGDFDTFEYNNDKQEWV